MKRIFTRRFWRFLWQRVTQGWDDSDTWNLDYTVAKFMLPRLRRFIELNCGYPPSITWEEWQRILGELVWMLEVTIDDDVLWDPDKETRDAAWSRYEQAHEYFGKYIGHLWW